MRIGLLQIIPIVIIAGIIFLTIRGVPAKKTKNKVHKTAISNKKGNNGTSKDNLIKSKRKKRMRWVGSTFLVLGIIAMDITLLTFSNVITAVFSSVIIFSLLSFIGILLGIIIILYSIRK